MQDQMQGWEHGVAVEIADVHPCSLEPVFAKRGLKAPLQPRQPWLWHQETSRGLGQHTGDPGRAAALGSPGGKLQGYRCPVQGFTVAGANQVGRGTETFLLPLMET